MKIYLDIDGVILTKDLKPANYLYEFLKYITSKHPVFWLTTHCKGNSDSTVNFLSRFLDPKIIEIAKNIQSTNWSTAKTEAIDYQSPFLWFDDYLFEFEKKDLIKHDSINSWIKVDLLANPNQLLDFINDFPIVV